MLQITLHAPFLDETILEFDSDDDIDTLLYQIISVSGKEIEPTNLVLLDKHGRDLVAVEDLSDVKYKQEHSGAANMKDTYYAEVWCVTKDSCDTLKLCTSCIPELPPTNTPGFAVDIEGLIQPVYSLVGTPYSVCGRCQQFFDMSLLTTKVAGLQGFQCNMRQLVEIGFAPPAAAEQAQLPEDIRTFTASSYPVVLYLKRQLLDRALAQLRSRPSSSGRSQEQHQQQLQHFQSRLASTARAVMVYEDPKQQAVALQHIDFERVRAYSEEHLAGSLAQATDARTQEPLSLTEERRVLEDKALLAGLMRWFKCDFFRWCNKPQCDNPLCGASPGRMDGIGAAEPSAEEKSVGRWLSMTGVIACACW